MANKIIECIDKDKKVYGYMFFCPACGFHHMFNTAYKNSLGAIWNFNGNLEKPTFSPSLLVNKGGIEPKIPICHLFVRDGKIQYLNDCTHNFAGKIIEMEDVK